MDSSNLSKSDVIAIVIGVINILVSVFAIIQVWKCYIRRVVHKRRKAALKQKENLASGVAENEIDEAAPQPCLNDNIKAIVWYSYIELSRIQGPPPPYPILPRRPPAAKLKSKL